MASRAEQQRAILRKQIDRHERLPRYAFPGGYPMVYLPAEDPGKQICGECAEKRRREASANYVIPVYDYLSGNREDHPHGTTICDDCGTDIFNL